MYLPAVQPFKLELRWLQAQAFRWTQPEEDEWYYGFVGGALIRVRQRDDGIEFESDVPEESLKPEVQRYFHLDQDIAPIHDALRGVDDRMARLVEQYGGMRILRQDPWECLVAYICSRNNRVKGITEIVERLADCYGTSLALGNVSLHAFPTPQRLAAVGPEALAGLAPGLSRGKRIHEVATHITDGHLDLTALARMRHQHARAVLMSYEGIGAKIADCVCLFALDSPEAFPVDGHIEEGLTAYGKKHTAGAANAHLMEWVRKTFGANAGYAGQLLFLEQYLKD